MTVISFTYQTEYKLILVSKHFLRVFDCNKHELALADLVTAISDGPVPFFFGSGSVLY